jgi:hypothetical protein
MLNFISDSNNLFISINNFYKYLNMSQPTKAILSYTILIYFKTLIRHMGSHITRTLFALHVTYYSKFCKGDLKKAE